MENISTIHKGPRSLVKLFDKDTHLEVAKKFMQRNFKDVYLRCTSIKNFKSPFLLHVFECGREANQGLFCLSMPFMRNANLENYLFCLAQSMPMINELAVADRLLTIAYQVSEAINFIHGQRSIIIHGDIHPTNILVDEHFNARLGDFGNSVVLAVGETEIREQARPMEKCRESKSQNDDIYSFGLVLIQMLSLSSEWKPNREFTDLRTELRNPDVNEMSRNPVFMNETLWQNNDIAQGLTEAAVACLRALRQPLPKTQEKSDRSCFIITADDLSRRMKKLMENGQLINWPGKQKCVYCCSGKRSKELLPQSSSCTDDCDFLKVCPSCMPTLGVNRVFCPAHDDRIHPAIGGERTHAIIIVGHDDDTGIQACFQRDCDAVAELAKHPRVMGIPGENVYRVALSDTEELETAMNKIKANLHSMTSLFMYYSGHCREQLRGSASCSDSEGGYLPVNCMREFLQEIAPICPRIVVIFDCCKAASVQLLELPSTCGFDDSHIEYHVQWSACGCMQNSQINLRIDNNSQFTKYLLAGLRGARCATDEENFSNCTLCVEFSESWRKSKYITLDDLQKYVRQHMAEVMSKIGRDDKQDTISYTLNRRPPAVLAYFPERQLFRFTYQPPADTQKHDEPRSCHLEFLSSCHQVKSRLLHKLPFPRNMHENAVELCKRQGHRFETISTVDAIIKADLDDELLYATVRTDCNNLDQDHWIACICSSRDARRIMTCIKNYKKVNEMGTYRQYTMTYDPKIDKKCIDGRPEKCSGTFYDVMEKCWNKFVALQLYTSYEIRLAIDVYEKLTLIHIEGKKRLDAECRKVAEFAEPVIGIACIDRQVYILLQRSTDQLRIYDSHSFNLQSVLSHTELNNPNSDLTDMVACKLKHACVYLFVSDYANKCILQFMTDHRMLGFVRNLALLSSPTALAVTVGNKIMVTCDDLSVLYEFSPDDSSIGGQPIDLNGECGLPVHALKLSRNRWVCCYKAETDADAVTLRVVDSTSCNPLSFGTRGSSDVNSPVHLALDEDEFIFVADAKNDMVSLFTPDLQHKFGSLSCVTGRCCSGNDSESSEDSEDADTVKEKQKDVIWRPHRLCFNRNPKRLFVATCRSSAADGCHQQNFRVILLDFI